jgi:hypothetical protein
VLARAYPATENPARILLIQYAPLHPGSDMSSDPKPHSRPEIEPAIGEAIERALARHPETGDPLERMAEVEQITFFFDRAVMLLRGGLLLECVHADPDLHDDLELLLSVAMKRPLRLSIHPRASSGPDR